jgi:hypothetical protein
MKQRIALGVTLALAGVIGTGSALADPVIQNDLVLGLSNSTAALSMEQVRGGAAVANGWNTAYMQSIEFDNYNGYSHNASGNMLALNFGTAGGSGSINWFATDGSFNGGTTIGTTTGATLSRLNGLSVSPANTKITVTGYDSGRVVVYDYAAGDGMSTASSLSGVRESAAIVPTGITTGTTWIDDNTVVAFSPNGQIYEVDATTMNSTLATSVGSLTTSSAFTDIEYNPAISPYVYGFYSAYSGGTLNKLFVLDPSDWSLDYTFDFSTSMNTAREIAFDSEGNLYVGQYSSAIDVILGADDPNNITSNVSSDYYTSATFSSYNGLDVAKTIIPEPATIALLAIGGLTLLRRRR